MDWNHPRLLRFCRRFLDGECPIFEVEIPDPDRCDLSHTASGVIHQLGQDRILDRKVRTELLDLGSSEAGGLTRSVGFTHGSWN